MAALIAFVVFLLGVGLVMGLYFGALRIPGFMLQRKLETRIDELTSAPQETTQSAILVKKGKEGPLPILDRLAGQSARGTNLGVWIEQSGMHISISGLVLAAVGCALVVGLIVATVLRMPVGWLIGGPVGFALPFAFLRIKRTRRMNKFEEEFPEALDLMSRALKAGHAFATGLKMVADEMAEPVGPEFRKTFDEQNFGLPLKEALASLTERMPLLDVRFFSTAVLIQRETGGNLSEILENLAAVVRERFKILRQVRVYTAHGRLTGYVLLALPAFLAVALSFINPEHMQLLFREHIGHILLLVAIVLQIVGFIWIRQVVKIEV